MNPPSPRALPTPVRSNSTLNRLPMALAAQPAAESAPGGAIGRGIVEGDVFRKGLESDDVLRGSHSDWRAGVTKTATPGRHGLAVLARNRRQRFTVLQRRKPNRNPIAIDQVIRTPLDVLHG